MASINAANQQAPTNRLFEANEREVKDIYTRTLGVWQGFSPTDLGALETIASQCPLEGGAAVYWARTMLYFVNDSLVFDDKSACESAGLQYRKAAPGLNAPARLVKIYPNPANDRLHIEVPESGENECSLWDAMGKCVMSFGFDGKTEVSTQKLPDGIYYYRIMGGVKGQKWQGKVIIQH